MPKQEKVASEVSIICPLYNAEKYLEKLHNNILKQKDVNLVEILYILTESNDRTEEILKEKELNYVKIKVTEFSHSRTREEYGMKAKGEILVFITQDVQIVEDCWLRNLVKPIEQGECEASFSRQICEENIMERYVREKNYPEVSRIVTKGDIDKYGLMTFFYSDASSAIKASVFKELNGYDGKDHIISEDMYIAHKIIDKGYRIKYCSDSKVVHYHNFTLKQIFNRYFDTGVFFRKNPVFLNYKTSDSGMKMARYVILESLKEGNLKVTMKAIPNFAARLIGSYLGRRYEKLSIEKRIKYSSNKVHWTKYKKEGRK